MTEGKYFERASWNVRDSSQLRPSVASGRVQLKFSSV